MSSRKLVANPAPPEFEECEIPEVVAVVGPKPEAAPRVEAPKLPGVDKSYTSLSKGKVVLAIDPGPEQSAWVLWDGSRVLGQGIEANKDVLEMVESSLGGYGPDFAIEMIASYGMAVGESTFETCVWIGRFIQAGHPTPATKVYRREVKLNLCGSMRAKDANVRQALIDRLGPQGTKKEPGPLYGIKSHTWAALAVAVTYLDGAR